MINELAELRERDIDDDRRRSALAVAPLIDGADAVLAVIDVRDVRCGYTKRQVVLDDAGADRRVERPMERRIHRGQFPHLTESRLMDMEIVIFGR